MLSGCCAWSQLCNKGLFVLYLSRHTPRSPFFVRQTQKPVNCSLGLIRLFWCCANRMQLKPLPLTFNSLACIQQLLSCISHSAVGWLAAEGWARGVNLPTALSCLLRPRKAPHTAVLQHLNLPGIQPRCSRLKLLNIKLIFSGADCGSKTAGEYILRSHWIKHYQLPGCCI